jgi:plastocyanin
MTILGTRWERWTLGMAAAVVVLALATGTGSHASGAAAGASATESVQIKGLAFHPKTLRLKRGGRVTFANADGTTHTATSAGFDTKGIKPGDTATVRFNQKRTFAYHCKIHPFMKGKVVVE